MQSKTVWTSDTQPFLTCSTLTKLAESGGTLQQTMSVITHKTQKTILIFEKKKVLVQKPRISAIIEVISKPKTRSSGQKPEHIVWKTIFPYSILILAIFFHSIPVILFHTIKFSSIFHSILPYHDKFRPEATRNLYCTFATLHILLQLVAHKRPVWKIRTFKLFRRSPAWKIFYFGVAARVEELLRQSA